MTSSRNADLVLQICVSSMSIHPKKKSLFKELFGLNPNFYAPLRLLNTSTGLLCDSLRAARINAFKTSADCKELLSFTMKHSDLQMERIAEVIAMYFCCILLSHRWEETETFLLVRPWDRYLLGAPDFAEQPDFTGDMESIGDWTEPGSPMDDSDKLPGGSLVEEEPDSRALRLTLRLGQPFAAFLLAQQHVREYEKIASNHTLHKSKTLLPLTTWTSVP
ncbi:hypothetical protein BDR05DRAFT_1063138 [Suillus weaverae]|nr:hypothetical protein BDR05DRAFT_1063138 [Suillus weaverae]